MSDQNHTKRYLLLLIPVIIASTVLGNGLFSSLNILITEFDTLSKWKLVAAALSSVLFLSLLIFVIVTIGMLFFAPERLFRFIKQQQKTI